MKMLQRPLVLCYLFSSLCWAIPPKTIVQEQAVPGGIKRILIESEKPPVLFYQKRRVAVSGHPGRYQALIGINIDAPIGKHTVWQISPQQKSYVFEVKPKAYQTQRLIIKNKRKVTPLAADQRRIDNESADFARTLAYWRDGQIDQFPPAFYPPLRGRISSTFGLRRIYNGIPKSPHLALDIAAARGTPVTATAEGRIINVDDRFYTGNTVIIDHGQGLMTLYAHLHRIAIENGEWVKRGQLIGTVGSTGRVTGPHLHWAIYLNQNAVDPLLFVSKRAVMPTQRQDL